MQWQWQEADSSCDQRVIDRFREDISLSPRLLGRLPIVKLHVVARLMCGSDVARQARRKHLGTGMVTDWEKAWGNGKIFAATSFSLF